MYFSQLTKGRTVLLAVLIFGFMVSPLCAAEKVLVTVGEVPITEYELSREQEKIMPMNATFHGGIAPEKLSKIREDALTRLIERAYKINYALAAGIALDKGALEQRVEQIQKKYPSYKEFKKATGKEGVDGVRASLQREMLAAKSEKLAIDDKVKVTEAEVKAYYEQNRNTFMRPRQYKASHIFVKVDPASSKQEREALLKKAQDLMARAMAGEDFYNLAYYNSDDRSKFVGGDIGYFHDGQTVKEFEAAVKKMAPGEISGPIKSMAGYHVIKLFEKNEPRQLTFDEVKEKIGQNLRAKQRASLYGEWMTALKAKYTVKRF